MKAVALASLAVLLAALGCAGGSARPRDAAPDADAPVADAAEAAPMDAAAPGSHLVVPGAAVLVGAGPDSCTNAPAPSGDRWCAFARPGDKDFTELWVVDVTKAAGGAAVACDGTDASCVRVSGRLFKSRANGFRDSGFNGDTLIYGETPYAGDSTSPFVGVLWAWRPGWTAGRALTSELGLYCVGQARSDAALCFENRTGDGMIDDVTVDLLAGHLSSVDSRGLPKIDTLLLASTTDAPGAPARCQFELSPFGRYVVWSTRTKTDPVETLHAYLVGSKGEPFVVARDVSQWAISPDEGAWYWLAGYNYDVTGAPSGTLQRSIFPVSTVVETLATGVGDFSPVGDKGLWLRADVTAEVGTLRFMADRYAPDVISTVDTKVLTVLDRSRDGARFLYAKTFAPVRPAPLAPANLGPDVVDLTVGSVTGDPPCVVSATPAALHAAIAPSGSVVVWDRYDPATGEEQGLATTVSSCETTRFASRLRDLLPAGDDAYVYLDDADATADEATLRYAHVVNGALAVEPPLQTRAARVFAPLAPALPAVAYTVATGTGADGLYIATLPATLPATSAVDASAGDASDGGAEP